MDKNQKTTVTTENKKQTFIAEDSLSKLEVVMTAEEITFQVRSNNQRKENERMSDNKKELNYVFKADTEDFQKKISQIIESLKEAIQLADLLASKLSAIPSNQDKN